MSGCRWVIQKVIAKRKVLALSPFAVTEQFDEAGEQGFIVHALFTCAPR